MASLARKIAEGTFIISGNNLVLNFIGFLTAVILIRSLGKFDFGLLTLALSACTIASIFLDLGLGNALIADIANELGNKRLGRAKSLLWRYAEAEVLMSSILFVVIFFSADFFAVKYNENVGTLVRISSGLLILYGIKNILTVAFSSHTRFEYLAIMQLIETGLRFFLVFILVVLMSTGVEGAMFAYLFSSAISILISYSFFQKTVVHFNNIVRARESLFFKTLKGHGGYVMAMGPFQTFNVDMPPWIIQYFLGVEAVAIFSVALKMQKLIVGLLEPIEQVLMPMISEITTTERNRVAFVFNKVVKYAVLLAVPMLIGAELFAPLIINLVFTAKYEASIPIFRILILTLLLSALNLPMRPIFFSLKAQKYLLISYFFNSCALLLVGGILTSFFGSFGMALAIVVGGVLMIYIRYYYLTTRFGLSICAEHLLKIDEYDKNIAVRIKTRVKTLIKIRR